MRLFLFSTTLFGLILFFSTGVKGQDNASSQEFENDVVMLVNQHREALGLSHFISSDFISEQARKHSNDMASGRIGFNHNNFEKRTAAIKEQIGGQSFSENVGYGHSTAQSAVNDWLKSKGHRDNIEGDFTHIGVGVAQSRNGTFYITQIFVKIDPKAIITLDDEAEKILQEEIVELVNQHRATLGLNPLIISDVIAEQSRIHSIGMASGKVRFSHDGFNKRSESIRKQLGGIGFAENVAYGQTTAESVVEGWLNSPGHRKNIEGNFTHIGVGIAQAKDRSLYYTQIFANLTSFEKP